jgi:ATP phosphoribosyltransferase regulatory subunit HisZ
MLPLHEDELALLRTRSIAAIGGQLATPMAPFVASRSRHRDQRIHVGLAVQSLKAAGLTDVRMDFGHTGIVRAVLAADAAAQLLVDDLLAALSAKDGPALAQFGAQLAPATAQALATMVGLHGAPADVLARAHESLPALPEITRALEDLAWLVARMPADGVSVDLADLHGYRYYTGVNFAAYAGSLGVHRAAVYSLRSRFLKGHNGYSHDL